MTLDLALAVPAALAVLFGAGFAANEVSHGAMSETMGLGHRHMMDMTGYHCVDHDASSMSHDHMQHMHGNNSTMPHENCPGGSGMHAAAMNHGHQHATAREE